MRFDSRKHDFNFGREKGYHIIFIHEICMIGKLKIVIEQKSSKSLKYTFLSNFKYFLKG